MGNSCSYIENDVVEIPTQQSWSRPDGKKTSWEKNKRKKISNDIFYDNVRNKRKISNVNVRNN